MKVPLGKSISKYGKGSLSSGLNGKPCVFSYKPLSDVLIQYTVAQARLKENSAKWVVEKVKLEEQLTLIRSEIAVMKKKVDEKEEKRKRIMQVLIKERQRRLGQQETIAQTQEPVPSATADTLLEPTLPINPPVELDHLPSEPAPHSTEGDHSGTPIDQTPTTAPLSPEKGLYECKKMITLDSKFVPSEQERVWVPLKEWESLLAEQASYAPTLYDALSFFLFGDKQPDWASYSGIEMLEKHGLSDPNRMTQLYQTIIHSLNGDVLYPEKSQHACHLSSVLQVLYDRWQADMSTRMDMTSL